MASYTVTASSSGISFAPATTAGEILQNVRTILATRVGTVPFDRAFGVSWDMVDMPLPVAKARMISDIVRAVQRYEPRASVTGVVFEDDADAAMDGQLRPAVHIRLDDAWLAAVPFEPEAETYGQEASTASTAFDVPFFVYSEDGGTDNVVVHERSDEYHVCVF